MNSVRAFHRSLPGYSPTPLVEARRTAGRLGVGHLWIKDEGHRFDLGAYKILGASWAARCGLNRLGEDASGVEMVAASEGNHGRAVARAARWLGSTARIYIPSTAAEWRIERTRAEQAAVALVDGDYDEAVRLAAAYAGQAGRLFVSDTALRGDEPSPRDVVDGYSTLFAEIDEQLAANGQGQPDMAVVQMGVGALAAAAVPHYSIPGRRARVVGVEPVGCDCIGRSVAAGRPIETAGPYDRRMAGLNCGRVSMTAWPVLRDGLGGCVPISPDRAVEAAAWLAEDGVLATPTGAAGLAGLIELRAELRGLESVLAIATEGDPRRGRL